MCMNLYKSQQRNPSHKKIFMSKTNKLICLIFKPSALCINIYEMLHVAHSNDVYFPFGQILIMYHSHYRPRKKTCLALSDLIQLPSAVNKIPFISCFENTVKRIVILASIGNRLTAFKSVVVP